MSDSVFSLRGKLAVVTGAARGIGNAIAAALAQAGASVVLAGRDAVALGAATEALLVRGYDARSVCADVSDPDTVEAAFDQLTNGSLRIDILVNNAGVEQLCPSLDVSTVLWDRIVGTNLRGAFFCAQSAARRMGRGGAILNVCSLTSEVGVPGAAAYGASKSGLAGLTRALATEWAPAGIRVNGIGPGYFRTAMTEDFYQDRAWQARMLDRIPLGRFGQMDDIGGAAVFLCSDAAAYITGQILYVDGGYLASI